MYFANFSIPTWNAEDIEEHIVQGVALKLSIGSLPNLPFLFRFILA